MSLHTVPVSDADTKQPAVAAALALGFDDVRFARADGTLGPSASTAPHALLPGPACLVVLFKAYRPSAPAPEGFMPLSAYYVASHFAYHAARAFSSYLAVRGHSALHVPQLPAKAAALRTGGFIGDNGFYYHPALGSLVCIQTVLTDAFLPDAPAEAAHACLHCGACRRACPSGGIGAPDHCVRRHSDALIPEALRGGIYQLLGCERCQAACPKNLQDKSEPVVFPIAALLDGSQHAALRDIVGAVMARPRRIVSQAALYAANTGQRCFRDQIRALAQNAGEPLRTHAQWAYEKFNGEHT